MVIDAPRVVVGADWVGSDDRAAMRGLGDYLRDLGHRAVGIIGPQLDEMRHNGPAGRPRWRYSGYALMRERIEGLLEGLGAQATDAGAAVQAGVEVPIEERFEHTPSSGADALHALLDRSPNLTAVCCLTDVLALGAMDGARQRGLTVPGDLTITGYDDVPPAALAGLGMIAARARRGEGVSRRPPGVVRRAPGGSTSAAACAASSRASHRAAGFRRRCRPQSAGHRACRALVSRAWAGFSSTSSTMVGDARSLGRRHRVGQRRPALLGDRFQVLGELVAHPAGRLGAVDQDQGVIQQLGQIDGMGERPPGAGRFVIPENDAHWSTPDSFRSSALARLRCSLVFVSALTGRLPTRHCRAGHRRPAPGRRHLASPARTCRP